jgi:hypothetical protein
MSFDESDPVRISSRKPASALIIPGGGVNATISGLSGPRRPSIRSRRSKASRCIAAALRNANAGQSTGQLEVDRPWDARTDDHNGLMDHVANDLFVATAACAVRLRGSKDSSASGTGLPNK